MTLRPLRALAAFALVVALGGACHTKASGPPPPDPAVFGQLVPRDDVDLQPYLAMAQAVINRAPQPTGEVPKLPGQRVIVMAWAGGRVAVGTGMGDSLMASVIAAAQGCIDKVAANPRIVLDVVTKAEPMSIDDDLKEPFTELGTHGYIVTDGTHTGAVPGEEILAREIFENAKNSEAAITRTALQDLLSQRAGVEVADLQKMNLYKVTTTSRLESLQPGRAIPLIRSMPVRPDKVGPTELLAAVRSGADYLSRVIDNNGRYEYMYHPVTEKADRQYGLLRHAGSTYALLEGYGEIRNPQYLARAELALDYLKKHITPTPQGVWVSDNMEEEQQKAGGNGLSMIAFAKHAEVTGQLTNLPLLQAMAQYLVAKQYADGHFRCNADVMREDPSKKKLKKEVTYYQGEAMLGLLRLYALDPNPAWLEAARKSADYLIDIRDVHDDIDHLTHDHWQTYALLDLYRATKVKKYADQAFKIASAILKGEKMPENAPHPDYAGTFYDQGQTTPTSTRLEAIASDIELARFMGTDEKWLERPAMTMATMMYGQQFTPDSAYFLLRPEKSVGGVRESLLNSDIRIDYVQHAMSAWLHYARLMRDPEWGKTAPPGSVGAPLDAGVHTDGAAPKPDAALAFTDAGSADGGADAKASVASGRK